ncbi:MAG: peptidoglycan-binding protein [Bifidobacteriaceae bacterium]|nr:peptidoglycan-binding protein [Bifidobacteriaceae bacterium]
MSTYRASTVLIQSAANVLYGQSLKTDGYYGNLTKAAVKVIQQRGGLAGKELDGAYGPITRGFAMYFPVDSPSVWKVRMMYEGGWDLKRR